MTTEQAAGHEPARDAISRAWPAQGAPTVSLSMIVADCDAGTVGHALRSAFNHVDEVVVALDPSSRAARAAVKEAWSYREMVAVPGTPVRAQRLHLVDFVWCADFAAARNASLAACTCDWVLVLDADEALRIDDPAEFAGALANPAIWFVPVTSEQDSGTTIVNTTTRLFPRLPSVRYEGALHETPVDKAGGLGYGRFVNVGIDHTGYTRAAADNGNKFARNIDILADMIAKLPQSPLLRLYLAQALHPDNPEAALDQARLAVYLCRLYDATAEVLSTYDQAASDIICTLGQLEQHPTAVMEGRSICAWREPAHAGFWVNLANSYLNTGMFHEAIAATFKAQGFASNHAVHQMDRSATTWAPEGIAGLAFGNLGRYDEAIACFRRALAHDPIEFFRAQTAEHLAIFTRKKAEALGNFPPDHNQGV